MSFGFEYTDTSGNVIIDQSYQNMGMRQKSTYSMTAGQIVAVSYTGNFPLIAINATGYAGVMQTDYSNYTGATPLTVTWYIQCSVAGTVNVYFFDVPAPSSSTFGMKIFDQAGNNVFNTDNNYLRVIDVWGATFSGSSRPTVTRSGYPSGTYAVVLGWPRLLFTSFTTPITYQTDGINCTSTSVTVASNVSGTGGNSLGWSDHTGYQYSGTSINMTINVTGY
jgi:hypothetical protein